MKTVVPTTLDIARESGWSGESEPKDFVGALKLLSDHIGPASPEAVTEAVNDWLDNHSEALVANGSVTTEKLADGAVTEEKLGVDLGDAPERVAELLGNQLTGTLSGTIDTASDTYAAPPMALTVEGNSTQAGTPTPDAPVPILSVDELGLEVCGKNLWGGEKLKIDVLSRTSASDTGEDANGPYVQYYLSGNAGKAICTGPFKESTRYTFLLYVVRTNSTSANCNLQIKYTDGTSANLQRAVPESATIASYTNFVSAAGKTVQGVYIQNHGSSTRLYYNQSGIFEGVYALSDFVPYVGTTVPDLLPEGTSLRSLPDGTRDTLNLSYLRPSTREGWAWYSREVVQRVFDFTLDNADGTTVRANTPSGYPSFISVLYPNRTLQPAYHTGNRSKQPIMCTELQSGSEDELFTNSSWLTGITRYPGAAYGIQLKLSDMTLTTPALVTAWLAENPLHIIYGTMTPTTETLDPIELPQLPVPNCTVWCDGGSAQPTYQMQYVQDTNIVIANMQAMLDDLATS